MTEVSILNAANRKAEGTGVHVHIGNAAVEDQEARVIASNGTTPVEALGKTVE